MPNRYKKQIIDLLTFLYRKIVLFVSGNKPREHLSSVSKFVAAMLNRLKLNLRRISISDLRPLYVIKPHEYFLHYK